MASNGRCDGSTGGREPPERGPDLVLLADKRRLTKLGRPFLDLQDFLPRLSIESESAPEADVVTGTSFAVSS